MYESSELECQRSLFVLTYFDKKSKKQTNILYTANICGFNCEEKIMLKFKKESKSTR